MLKHSFFLFLFLFCSVSLFAQMPSNPCEPGGIHPISLNSNGVSYTYAAATGSSTAASFLGQNSAGCLSSIPRPAWFYLRVDNPGSILIHIVQTSITGQWLDADFICWGPFAAASGADFENNLCNHNYDLTLFGGSSHHPADGNHQDNLGGYPVGNIVDCSYNAANTEWCYIPNAQTGEYYLLLVTNFSNLPGFVSFNREDVAYATGTTDNGVLASVNDNTPVCEGGQLELVYGDGSATGDYTWIAPDGTTYNTTIPSWSIPNVSAAQEGVYKLVRQYNPAYADTVYSNPISVNSKPEVTFFPSNGDIFLNGETITVGATVTNYPYAFFSWNGGDYDSIPVQIDTLSSTFILTQDTCFNLLVLTDTILSKGCNKNHQLCIRMTDVGVEDYVVDGKLEVYPNPTTGWAKLELKNGRMIQRMEAFDGNGRLVKVVSGPEIDLSDSPDGLYLLRVYAEDESYSIKLVKKQ